MAEPEQGNGTGQGPARGYFWPPFEDGNDAALKHGAFSEAKIKPRAEEIAVELREIVPLESGSDAPSIWLLSLLLARIAVANEWLAEHGIFRDESTSEPQPILRALSTWENSAQRLLDRLGLTIAGRAEVGLQLAGTAALVRRHDLSALSLEELGQLRALTVKAKGGTGDAPAQD